MIDCKRLTPEEIAEVAHTITPVHKVRKTLFPKTFIDAEPLGHVRGRRREDIDKL